jgi:hypothetical protein
MRSFLSVFLCLALTGCDNFIDYFSPAATQAILIGVDELPEGIELGAAAEASVFVARAQSLSSFSANLVGNAEQVSLSSESGVFDLNNLGNGGYELSSLEDTAFEYIPEATWTLTIVEGGKTRTTSVTAPARPQIGDPSEVLEHSAGASLDFDLSGQGFDNYVVAVGQVLASGDFVLTYDSRPTSAQDYVDWLKPGSGDVGQVTLPGSAFPDPLASYVVGIAGMRKAAPANFRRLNPAISNLAAGSMAGRVVVTGP